MDIINYSNDFYFEIEGKENFCISLKEIFRNDMFNMKKMINISKLIKEASEYKISFIFDPLQICKIKSLSKEEKEENKRIKDEMEKAKIEGRHLDALNLLSKLKEARDEIREIAKKGGNFKVISEKRIEANYPVDYDKSIWQEILSKDEGTSFWENYNEKMEEILKHPESNYSPGHFICILKKFRASNTHKK